MAIEEGTIILTGAVLTISLADIVTKWVILQGAVARPFMTNASKHKTKNRTGARSDPVRVGQTYFMTDMGRLIKSLFRL